MTKQQLIDAINANVKQNGNENITGPILNNVLRAIVDFTDEVTTPTIDVSGNIAIGQVDKAVNGDKIFRNTINKSITKWDKNIVAPLNGYAIYDMVYYSGKFYMSNGNNNISNPSTDTTGKWTEITFKGDYTLPIASSSVLGGVKVDGTSISIDPNGVISLVNSGNYISFSVTKTELDSLITSSSLIPNALYEISGCDADLYGGTTLYLRAVTNNELEINGIGKFYNPKYNQEVDGYGIYDVDETYKKDDTTIWGGRKWICKATTANEEPIDQFTLDDTKWNVVPYNDTEYNVAFDEIKYDYANDWIAERHEVEGGNIVSCSKATYDWDNYNGNFISYNAIKSFQWGNSFANMDLGVFANTVNESWFDCLNSKGFIYSNNLNGGSGIYDNTLGVGSYINNNTLNNGGSISSNTLNSGSIYSNTLNSSGFYNNTLNNGGIDSNTLNSGSISSNTLNRGRIQGNTLDGRIESNTLNSGNISLGTLTTNVYDTVFYNSGSATLGATAKTILSSDYSKEVKTNASNQTVIQYINESNQLTIVPITS